MAENAQEEQVLHDSLEWRQSLRSLSDVGAWRDSSRNLIVAAGDGRPVNVAEMSVSGFRVADGSPLTLVGTAIIFTVATLLRDTEFRGSENDLTITGTALIIGCGIVMLASACWVA